MLYKLLKHFGKFGSLGIQALQFLGTCVECFLAKALVDVLQKYFWNSLQVFEGFFVPDNRHDIFDIIYLLFIYQIKEEDQDLVLEDWVKNLLPRKLDIFKREQEEIRDI